MDKYSLVIYSKDQLNQDKSKTIGYIDSNAQPSDLKLAAQQLNALTTNTYESADRVARENVDTASDISQRNMTCTYNYDGQTYSLDLNAASVEVPLSHMPESKRLSLTVSSNAEDDWAKLIISDVTATEGTSIYIGYQRVNYTWNNLGVNNFEVQPSQITTPFVLTMTLKLNTTDKYVAWSKVFVINFTEG